EAGGGIDRTRQTSLQSGSCSAAVCAVADASPDSGKRIYSGMGAIFTDADRNDPAWRFAIHAKRR
ncbi:MAG: hypothetical protein ACK4S3_00670, partial [Parvibaculum sp.]